MVNGKVNLGNGSGKCGIKMGNILTREELNGGILRPGRGVVVKQRGENYFAVGDENSAVTDEGKDILRKNLIGAGYNNERAFLVVNDKGTLKWEENKKFFFGTNKQDTKPDASSLPASGSQVRI